MTTPEEIKTEYTSSLADLTFNSKPLINVLTMLAEENLPNAKTIVEAIEEHLYKVATDVKLPILYLIDCIVKNVGETYTGLFSQNIVSTFCTVFKKALLSKVDEKTRLEMFKLRQTWNDVFPQMKLYAIDVQIHQIDPAWPVTAQPTNSIHLNPKFLKTTPATTKSKVAAASPIEVVTPTAPVLPTKPVSADLDKETRLMQEQLMQKQKELLELQRKTLELEVLQTQVKLQEQMKAGGVPSVATNILLKPEVAKQFLPDAVGKPRPTDMINSLVQKPHTNQLKINPVNSALAAARPIRDPRLLRQQQDKQTLDNLSQQTTGSAGMLPNSTVLDTNKHITNKVGVRNFSKDPRLSSRNDKKNRNASKTRDDSSLIRDSDPSQKVDKNSRADFDKSINDSRFTSSSNSNLSSASSNNLHPMSKNKRVPGKNRKRDKPETKRNHDFDTTTFPNKREKVSPKEEEKRSSDSKQTSSTFKNVKGKSRNYVRRNLVDSPPVQQDDDDLTASSNQSDKNDKNSSAENLIVKQKSPEASTHVSPISSMDVDLRKSALTSTKKRSSETSEPPAKRKSFDVLFGSEDTDLRQLPMHADSERKATVIERPPTPPPPIISSKKDATVVQEMTSLAPKKSNFDAVRAKLANATNREKVMNKSFHKNKIQQTSTDKDLRPISLQISSEDEKAIRSGHMTSEQEKQFLNKFLSQIEQDKLRQAKKKDHEEALVDMSLQEISDEDFGSDSEDSPKASLSHRAIPFNDKDERLRMHMPGPMGQVQRADSVSSTSDNGSYMSKGDNRRTRFRGGSDWRGRGRVPLQGPQPRPPIRPWLHQQQHPRWGGSFPDDSSRSPIAISPSEDLEMTIVHEENKTLNIDGIPRDIRIYNETAIIFINYDDPREISFQSGARRVIFNNKETYLLMFGNDYTECTINNFPFRVKLGVPSREIFINDLGFECFFGGPPVHICVSSINMTVQLDGPLPQVKIGEVKRTDLVVGKINLIINATLMIPVFLDGKLQTFMVEGEPCTIKFVDALKRVLINDVPFNVEFGGLPKPCIIHGKKHFIRFSVLPKGIRPGFVRIKDMEGEEGSSPVRDETNIQPVLSGPLEAEPLRPDTSKLNQARGHQSPDNGRNSPGFFNNILQTGLGNLDVISNVLSQSLTPAPSTGGYQVELPGLEPSATPAVSSTSTINVPAPNPTLNINELFQKLVDSGFLTTQDNKQSDVAITNPPVFSVPQLTLPKEVASFVGNGKGVQKPYGFQDQTSSKPQKRNISTALKPVSFGRPETLKIRQGALYAKLYTGMQCSSCGMRFSPEASMWYSQHLDWHFRQNRKGKKNARVANSRKWYYSLADWKNYEELEDLEEREKNYFDQQQQVEVAEEAEEEVEIPSVTADPGTTDERCYVCRDVFEQFFNEEKEEWHLRNSVRIDEKTYHPICYEDHQKSSMDQSRTEDETPSKLIPGLEIVLDDDDEELPGTLDEVVSLMDDAEETVPEDAPSPVKDEEVKEDDDDDDVILNEVAPIKIVVDDDDDDEELPAEKNFSSQPVVIKKEKNLEYDDGFMDVGEIVSLQGVGQVKIKSEPVDDDMQPPSLNTDEHNLVEEDPIDLNVDNEEVSVSKPVRSRPELIASMDGNVELVATTPMPVPTTSSGGPKIKINISKPLPVITPKDISTGSSDSDVSKSIEVPMEEPEILRYKPALQNVPLKKMPPVKKGHEMMGLCSIM
ncbi:pre-mRNA cleavage complex 2 protein Pcf11 isoform X1 [Dendroctonus ponderosae]|uniref:pre-mRNA cleavage complex 2 protein Pcf11 isoform X1 n=1 Tax=Dendroctonus ponderosae TaxID=77166 RepID=UPI002035FE21|nr:pre-mRNA cleavage complex 2 protein Pcf11 isoform X1 [Dendroctonus ponderosae]XP_048526468.1 pre-mRNA cleavage complex 2 protein Pcf11 isoform X1 [Dendroctonus ponderosae]XP_048526469.1 pre-mRNA cleavage complex 2 protein Pcf11 isoform X1 [Dendroctonus ponderosae]